MNQNNSEKRFQDGRVIFIFKAVAEFQLYYSSSDMPIIPCTCLFATWIANALFQIPSNCTRMAFRRPPPDVDRMTSLRVGNLPYSVVIEVCDRHLRYKAPTFPHSLFTQDLEPLFEKFGDVGDIYLPTERGTGRF